MDITLFQSANGTLTIDDHLALLGFLFVYCLSGAIGFVWGRGTAPKTYVHVDPSLPCLQDEMNAFEEERTPVRIYPVNRRS